MPLDWATGTYVFGPQNHMGRQLAQDPVRKFGTIGKVADSDSFICFSSDSTGDQAIQQNAKTIEVYSRSSEQCSCTSNLIRESLLHKFLSFFTP